MATPSFNFDPSSSFNFEPSPSFSFSDPGVNPMMQPVPILGQQGVGAPKSVPKSAPSSNFNEGNLLSGLASLGAALNEPRQTPGGLFGLGSVDVGSPVDFSGIDFSNLDLSGVNFGPLVESSFQSPENFGADTRFSGGIGSKLGNFAFDTAVPAALDFGRDALEFFTGEDIFSGSLKGANEVNDISQFLKSPEVSSSMEAEALARLNKGVQPGSPQANFLAEKAKGDLTSKQIEDADAFAKSIGTTFDPTFGFGRTPFLESQAVQPQITQEQLEQLTPSGPIEPMGQDATRAMLQQRFGAPTISAIQNLPSGQGSGIRTDAQGRMVAQGDDRTAFDQASQERLSRLEQRDLLPGETITERDTRIADSRTEGADKGGKMSFEEARKFVPKGERESTKAYNQRIKSYQAQQNSAIGKLKKQYEQYRIQGQKVNNERTLALIANYQQTEPEKYREVFATAQEMLRDGILQDNVQVAMYIVSQMKGNVSAIFDPATQFMGGDDGGAGNTTGATSTMMHPDGVQRRNVPAGQVEEAKAAGYTLI